MMRFSLDIKMRGVSHGWKPWASWVCVLLFVCAVQAQSEDAAALDLSGVLAELGDDDYAIRQDATYRLLTDDKLTPDDLDQLYAQSQSLEQRHRLLRIARHHLIRRMIEDNFGGVVGPGSMGLSHHVVRITGPDMQTERAGVMVVMTLPGFPAYALLEPGDVIVDFAGEPIPERITRNQFQQLIRTHQSGELIDLVVMRNGKAKEVPFMLCQGQALGAVYDDQALTLNEPYRGSWHAERERIESLIEPIEAQPNE